MRHSFDPEAQRLCDARLSEITPAIRHALVGYSKKRLLSMRLPPDAGEDVVQKVFESLAQGHRRPTRAEAANLNTFIKFLLSAVKSTTNAFVRTNPWHARLEDHEQTLSIPDATPDEKAAVLDLKDELFTRLKRRARPHLLPTIDSLGEGVSAR